MDDSLSIGIREFKWLLLVLAALTFSLNSKEFLRYCKIHVFFGETWDGFPFRGTTLFADEARRELSHYDTPGGVYLLLSNPADGILPIERPLLHALSWSVIPQKVRSGCLSDVAGEDAVVSLFSSEEPDFTAAGLSHRGFHRISKDGGVGVWLSSTSKRKMCGSIIGKNHWREAASVLVFLVCGTLAFRKGRFPSTAYYLLFFSLLMIFPPALHIRPSAFYSLAAMALSCHVSGRFGCGTMETLNPLHESARATISLLYAAFSIGLILTHTFFSPNGLAVYGGKAKCLFESSGCSQDFFVCREWAHLQPAYPPGLALATLGMYGLAGMCGEYATQWMPMTIAVLVLFYFVAYDSPFPVALWILAIFLTPAVLQISHSRLWGAWGQIRGMGGFSGISGRSPWRKERVAGIQEKGPFHVLRSLRT